MEQKSLRVTLGHGMDGLAHCIRTQRSMRIHFLVALTVMAVAALLHVGGSGLLVLFFSVTLVIVMEMVNTGVEVIVDWIKPSYDPRAKIIKDVCAGAVLLSSISAAVIGLLVYLKSPVVRSAMKQVQQVQYPVTWTELGVEAFLILFLVVMAWRSLGSLSAAWGGRSFSMPAVFGFFCAALIILYPSEQVRLLSALLMAMMLVIGQTGQRAYSLRQVAVGAVLGMIVPGVVFAAHHALASEAIQDDRRSPIAVSTAGTSSGDTSQHAAGRIAGARAGSRRVSSGDAPPPVD